MPSLNEKLCQIINALLTAYDVFPIRPKYWRTQNKLTGWLVDLYNEQFYVDQQGGSKRSAEEVVPLVMQFIHPKSVVDVGCGVGTWLSVFAQSGVKEIFGIDGEWVDTRFLQIPESSFLRYDLKEPLSIARKFDLVVCLELAEHLPSDSAKTFVSSLVRLGPVVLFSAAIPMQKGTNHVNEQWPDYWVKLFSEKDYVVVDALRRTIWRNPNVESWYAQNMFFFVDQKQLENYPQLKAALASTNLDQLSIVHPRIFVERTNPKNLQSRELLKALPTVFKNSLKRKAADTLKKVRRKNYL